jgi:hypothetical protein
MIANRSADTEMRAGMQFTDRENTAAPNACTDLRLDSLGISAACGPFRIGQRSPFMVSWLDRLQRRSRSAGFLIAIIYKYVDDQGSYLAALITYYAFVSLFPALLLLTTVLGVVLLGHPELQEQILQSAVAQLPVIGDQLGHPQGLSGGTLGVVVGIAGALYGGLGVGQAVQNASVGGPMDLCRITADEAHHLEPEAIDGIREQVGRWLKLEERALDELFD